jgi:RNA polymerase sigma factor (sigma-70 family)
MNEGVLSVSFPTEASEEAADPAPSCPAIAPETVEALRLAKAIAAGDAGAFALFYEAWFDRAYSLARRLTRRDESFCLDVVQEAMLRVIRSIRGLSDPAGLDRWMARIIHTTALDLLRREARRARREVAAARGRSAPAAQPGADPCCLEVEERVAWLEARLEELPAGDRALIRERFERGGTLRDVGRRMGLTGNAVNGRIARAVRRLRGLAKELFHD